MKYRHIGWILLILIVLMLTIVAVSAQATYPIQIIATGGGSNHAHEPLINALKLRAEQWSLASLEILVLPVGVGSNPDAIPNTERNARLAAADLQRQEIETACQDSMPAGVTCSAILVPVVTRPDAQALTGLQDLSNDPDAIVFLQDNAQEVLEILQGSKLAEEIVKSYQAGTILNGAGNLFSNRLLHGYRPGFAPASALTFGAVLADEASGQAGLGVFSSQVLVDIHPFSENRVGLLINSISGPVEPHIGIGIEANTSFQFVEQNNLLGFSGESVVAILDAETYHSADAITYQPGTNLIGLRNILLHLFASSTAIYNIDLRENSQAPLPVRVARDFDTLHLPDGAGPLMLTSGLQADSSGIQSLIEFTNLSGGQNANLMIIAAGYPENRLARGEVTAIADLLEVPSELLIIPPEALAPIEINADITGIILTGPDPASIQPDTLLEVKNRWLAGIPVLGDRAGAAILGFQYPSSQTPDQALPAFTPGRYQMLPGLGFVQACIEPSALTRHSWERTITCSYLFPETLSIGLSPSSALRISSDSVNILGANVVTLVDFRSAAITSASSGIFEIANGLVDIYTPGEQIQALIADADAAPIHASTPELATPTLPPTATATATTPEEVAPAEPIEAPREKPPTRTPRPTTTPVPTPPPSDPGTTNLMVFFGVLSVVVVIVGVWLNRQIAAE